MNNTKGFTLVELLVVVLIIGILTAIAVPQYKKSVAKSQFSTLKFMVKAIVEAQEAYYLANGKYATKFNNLDITMPKGIWNNDNTYSYDWGYCTISDYHIQCRNTDINMTLDFYYNFASTTPNLRACIIEGTQDVNDYRNGICKEETGATTNTPSSYNSIFWFYK